MSIRLINATKLLPFVQAAADGKTIKRKLSDGSDEVCTMLFDNDVAREALFIEEPPKTLYHLVCRRSKGCGASSPNRQLLLRRGCPECDHILKLNYHQDGRVTSSIEKIKERNNGNS